MNHYPLINSETHFDMVIVANGSYPENEVGQTIIRHARHLIACDGAALSLIDHGIRSEQMTVVGDGDSLSAELKTRLNFFHIAEQDDNDLTKATRYATTLPHVQEGSRIAYLGTTGKREDHSLANISLMMCYYSEFHLQPIMITDHGYFIPTQQHLQNVCPTASKYLQFRVQATEKQRPCMGFFRL